MKKNVQEESLIITAIIILCVLIIGLFVTFILMQIQGGLRIFKDSVSMILSNFASFYDENRTYHLNQFDESVLGFGIYDSIGNSLTRTGTAPLNLAEQSLATGAEIADINEGQKVLLAIKSFFTDNKKRIIYVELDIRNALSRFELMRVFILVGSVLFLVVIIVFVILYRRIIVYRNKMIQFRHLGEMARVLSHEIKNPLGAIRIQTGYLKRTIDQKQHKPIDIIEEEVQRLTNLTSRINSFITDAQGNPTEINLVDFLQELINRFKYYIQFIKKVDKAVYIKADPFRFHSVIENLIQNAIESMEQLKKPPEKNTIKIILAADKRKIKIVIIDKGVGIAPELKQRIFDPFFTTKTKGSGIGLYIARRFLEPLGGSLTLQSNKHSGACACIVLNRFYSKEKGR